MGACIESAIAVKWDNKEIIVVDDGSVDRSVEIARQYKEVSQVLLKKNGGQYSSSNMGFAASKGELVIFLDADDLLHPDIMIEAMKVYNPAVSKIQFQMMSIDADGNDLHSTFPQFAPGLTAARVRKIFSNTLSYPNPPGSGNIYARKMLEKIFPLDGIMDTSTDTYCVAAAPIFGDVETVQSPMVMYRIHGSNEGAMQQFSPLKIEQEVMRSSRRFGYALSRSALNGNILNPAASRRNLHFMPYRAARLRSPANANIKSFDTRWIIFKDVLAAVFVDQGFRIGTHLSLALTSILFLFAPKPLAIRLITWRFSPSTRPDWLKRGLRTTKIA